MRARKFFPLSSPFGPHSFLPSYSALNFQRLFSETPWSYLWILGNISFPLSLLAAYPSPSYATPMLPPPWLLPHSELLHPCGMCPFLELPSSCFCKIKQCAPRSSLCPKQAPMYTILKHLRALRAESSALMAKAQTRGLKSNSWCAYACLKKGCSSQPSQGIHIIPVPHKELLLYWRD